MSRLRAFITTMITRSFAIGPCVWLLSPVVLLATEPSVNQWAIVAADAKAAPLADLLTAELSEPGDIQLVERDQISRVLDELQLNATTLVQRDRATKFGQLSQANGLVIIDAPEPEKRQTQMIRVRLIDTRTSVRLLDIVFPSADMAGEVGAIGDELKAASTTLLVPPEQLRLISVLPIISSEPGHLLKPYCHALTALVAAEFFRQPGFVVLERSDLQRLTAESDLSGLELQLRGATRLLHVSVRRTPDGEGILATCQINTPGAAESESFEVVVSSREPVEARSLIVKQVLGRVGKSGDSATSVTPELEAQSLDRRSKWLVDEDAVAMTEAAFALAPTQQRLQAAIDVNAALLYRKSMAKQALESLLADRRRCELCLRYLQKYKAEFSNRTLFPIYYNYGKPPVTITDEENQLLVEVGNLRQQILQKELSQATKPLDRIETLGSLIDVELNWPVDTPNPAHVVAQYLRSAFALREPAGIPVDVNNPYYNELVRLLVLTIKRASVVDSSDRWRINNFDTWSRQLEELNQPFAESARLCAQTRQPGPRGLQAARQLAANIHKLPVVDVKHVDLPFRRAALNLLPDIEVEQFFHQMLDRVERESTNSQLLVFRNEIRVFLDRLSKKQSLPIARRMVKVLNSDKEMGAALSTLSMLSTLHKFVPQSDSPFKVTAPFSLEDAPGPWKEYRVIPIKLKSPGNRRLRAISIDRSASAPQDSIALAWSLPNGISAIERTGLTGGTPQVFGPPFAGAQRHYVKLAVGSGMAFIASSSYELGNKAPSFMKVTDQAVTNLKEEQGAASNDIDVIAFCNDRLYIGYPGAFGTYDPVNDQFQLLASSASVRSQNPLDGRGKFLIRQLLADPQHGCLWLSVHDKVAPGERTGLWRFEIDNGQFTQVSQSHVDISLAPGGLLLHRNAENKIAWVDAESSNVTEMPEFAHASDKLDMNISTFETPVSPTFQSPYPKPHLIKIGNHLISDNGKLFTADGKTHQLDFNPTGSQHPIWSQIPTWLHLQRYGDGFITHYESARRTLWYVEPEFSLQAVEAR
ncbi:MAG: hypothetical protein WBD20_13420 [Pirellulaceae bacterium]